MPRAARSARSILELGGKNPAIVSRHADLEDAAIGIMRSAFGLQGQKCSACSRVYIEEPVYDDLVERLVDLTNKLKIGDPTDRTSTLARWSTRARTAISRNSPRSCPRPGQFLTGGKGAHRGRVRQGLFLRPDPGGRPALNHRLWKHEMFLPITTIAQVKSLEEAMGYANDVNYGLTAGFYGARTKPTGSSTGSRPA